MNAMKSKKESPRSLVRVAVTSLGLGEGLASCSVKSTASLALPITALGQ